MNKSYLIIHHSAVSDNLALKDFDAIKKYHMSYAVDGEVVFKEEFDRRKSLNIGSDFKIPWKDIGYFVVIEYIGNKLTWTQGRRLSENGAHCSQESMNVVGLGICIVGNYDFEEPLQEVLDFLSDFVASLIVDVPSLTYERIKKHSRYAPYKTCPGIKFPWELFLKKVKRAYIRKLFISFIWKLFGKKKIFVLDKVRA